MSKNIIECAKCNNKGWIFYIDENGEERCKFCTCWKQRKLLGKMNSLGLGKYFEKTFDDFRVRAKWQEEMKIKATSYVNEGFENGAWFMLCGQYGSGKTLLASIIIKEIMQKHEDIVPLAIVWSSFVEQFKMSYKLEQNDKFVEITNTIEDMKDCDLLYLDEIFKVESPSALNLLFDIINYRYLNEKPTIITSEVNFDVMKDKNQAVVSRMYEETKGIYIVNILQDGSKNQRMKNYGG